MSAKPKILCVCDSDGGSDRLPAAIRDSFELVEVPNPLGALTRLARENFSGMYIASNHLGEAIRLEHLLENERILDCMPDGVVLLDGDNTILWANQQLRRWSHVCGQSCRLAIFVVSDRAWSERT